MEWRHESHIHDSLCTTKTDNSSPAKYKSEASCDPWCRFGLLLILSALKFLVMTHVVGPGAGPEQQGLHPKPSCPGGLIAALHVTSPLFLLRAVFTSLAQSSLLWPPTRQLGSWDSSFSWGLSKQIQVVLGSKIQPLQGRRRVSSCPGRRGCWGLSTLNVDQDTKQHSTHHRDSLWWGEAKSPL